jgi:hypothetical protein
MEPRTPAEAAAQFGAALAAKDAAAAEALCTTAGWSVQGDTPRKIFEQGVRKGFLWQMLPLPIDKGDRAAVAGLIVRPDQGRQLGDAWLLLVREEGFWRVDGATKAPAIASLFVKGVLTAQPRLDTLPPSPDAEAWARSAIAHASTGRAHLLAARKTSDAALALGDLGQLGALPNVRIEPLATYALDAAGRAMAGLSFTAPSLDRPDQRWIVLARDGADGALVVHSQSLFPSLEALSRGVDLAGVADG